MGIKIFLIFKFWILDFNTLKKSIVLSILNSTFFILHSYSQGAVVVSDNVPAFQKEYKVVLMLPFCIGMSEKYKVRDKMADYYEGVEMAIVELEKQGIKMKLIVLDTKQDSLEVIRLLANPEMQNIDLLIGPVYENEMVEAQKFCSIYKIPMVSPFRYTANITGGDFPLINCVAQDSIAFQYIGKNAANNFKKYQVVVVSGDGKTTMNTAARNFKTGYELASGKICIIVDGKIKTPSNVWNGKDSLLIYCPSKNSTLGLSNAKGGKWVVAGSADWLDVERTNYTVFEGVNFYDAYCVPAQDTIYKKMRKTFRTKYGGDPQRYTFVGYDQLMFFGSALMTFDTHFYKHILNKNFRLVHTNYQFVQRGNLIENAGINLFYYSNYQLYKSFWRY